MNRAERRKAEKQIRHEDSMNKELVMKIAQEGLVSEPRWKREDSYKRAVIAAQVKQRENMERNGITKADLEKEFKAGYNAATKEITRFSMQMFYCAGACALKRLFGFGEKRILRTLDLIQEIMEEEITTTDMMQRCKDETGIDIIENEYNG